MIVKNVSTACTHCGIVVPLGLIEPGRKEQFCCNGCSAAYHLIRSNGLEAFYRMVDSSSDQQTLRERERARDQFSEFDEASFREKFVKRNSVDLATVTLALDGIHCAACIWLLEKLPGILAGVTQATAHWSRGTIRIVWNDDQVNLSEIAMALFRLGYKPYPFRRNEKTTRRERENRQHLAHIGIAAAAAGNNMLISIALYLGMFLSMSTGMEWMLRVASCTVGIASLCWPGRVFLRGAWNALKTRTPHMDLPIALGLLVGTITGLVNTIRGTGEIYFDSLSVLIFLLLVGRWIQFRQQNRAADAIELLYRLTPQRARKMIDGRSVEVDVDQILLGDEIEIRPGDLIPTDALVMRGQSMVDESILTGESKPTHKRRGDPLSAGTKNLNALLLAKAIAIGQENRISKIVGLIEHASSERPKVVQWANRIGGYFVVTVIVLAFATFCLWWMIESSLAVDRAVALLIVACPCALALATPLTISVALGRMAKRKIMIKAGDVLQSLDQPGIIWLDKTGTLTEGQMRVVDWMGDSSWIRMVAAVESKFSHPIADAFIDFSKSHGRSESPAQSVEIEDAQSVTGGVAARSGSRSILIGNRELIESQNISIGSMWTEIESKSLANQWAPCWIAVDGQVVAIASLGDRIRDDAFELVQRLEQTGWSVGVLSGDHPAVVNEIARTLKIKKVHAGVTPERKINVIRDSTREFAVTVMVGDGVNDSAALAAATVGIAVHGGAEASLAAAPVYLGRPGLAPILDLLQVSRSTCRTIRINFAASLGYNGIGAALAMFGWINPLVAAVLMPISSFTVIAISLRAGIGAEKTHMSNPDGRKRSVSRRI